MKAFKYILFLLLIGFIGASIYIAVQPNEFKFSRSKIIKAPTPVVFDIVNDYKQWPRFSPWIEQDTAATLTYNEKTVGIDAGYAWNGEILGVGNAKTLSLTENKTITQDIEFIEPFKSTSEINWDFETTEEGTKVTWTMSGIQDFKTKAYTIFGGSIEAQTASDFERGLYKLDSIAVTDIQKYNVKVNGVTKRSGGFYLYKTVSCKMNELSSKMATLLPEVGSYAISNNVTFAGPPFVYYHKWDEKNNAVIFSACIPTTSQIFTAENSDILTGELQSFKAIETTLTGNYTNLKEAWGNTMAYIPENGFQLAAQGPMIETYLNDPSSEPNPAKWVTKIYIAINDVAISETATIE